MPKVASTSSLGMFTEQYNEGVLTDWEYIERVLGAVNACLETANGLLYADVKKS